MKIKTAVIYNEVEELKYLVVDGDWTRFQGIYINSSEDTDELSELIYDEYGRYRVEFTDLQGFAAAIRDGALVVQCGFLP